MLALRQLPGDEVNAVRIHGGDNIYGSIAQYLRRAAAENFTGVCVGRGQLLGKFQQNRRRQPLVCVMRGVI